MRSKFDVGGSSSRNTILPNLCSVHKRPLLCEVACNEPLFHPLVEGPTPPTIYRATMAMNSAQAWHVSELYGPPALMKPFVNHGLVQVGKELSHAVFEASDYGHRSDIAGSNNWASNLALLGWLSLHRYR
ncbi:MAG: hypothetical protein ACR2PL_04485 [Dehalococcoidia bacterium]